VDYRERWELKEFLIEQRLERRVTLFHAGALLLLLSYLLAFWFLQVARGEEYARLAETNRLREIPLLPTRGVLLDRRGEIIASTRPSLRLLLRREGLIDRDEQLRRLEDVLAVPYENLLERLDQASNRPVFEPAVLKEDLSLGELAPIEARREWFPSVEFEQTARRTYPFGAIASHVLGYVGEVSERELVAQASEIPLYRGDIVGKSGIERHYDEGLRGERGSKYVTVNSLGRQLGEGRSARAPINGGDLQLTLDLQLQRTLVEALGDEVGAGVFMDPRNGEILALASTPTYDPNIFAGKVSPEAWTAILHDPRRPLHDRAIASFYAPGSTFKVVMAIAGLETGTVSPGTTVTCGGSARFYGRNFLCWKKGGHGTVSIEKALAHSCNVYFYSLGKSLGIEPIHEYGARFNLGSPTGIDLPGEAPGVLPSDAWKRKVHGERWYPGETISVSIGQGLLAVTPVQLANTMSGVATGKLPMPHLVLGEATEPVDLDLSTETLRIVRNALEEAVARGTGRRAALEDVVVAGKTGTAQVYKSSAGIDADELPKNERDHAWFVGYAPAEDPRIAFAVVVERGGHGGTSAAPVARKVLEVFFSNKLPRDERDSSLRTGATRSRGIEDVGTAASR
jgi:penicillin-binding protein 2